MNFKQVQHAAHRLVGRSVVVTLKDGRTFSARLAKAHDGALKFDTLSPTALTVTYAHRVAAIAPA